MKKVLIAVIDDGIDRLYFPEICKEVRYQEDNKRSYISHATFCAAIIKKHVKVPVEIINICILDEEGCGDIANLQNALEWCYINNVDIINLSLGSTKLSDRYLLKKIVNDLAQKGVILVCASDNIGKVTYPACFTNAIGVKSIRDGSISDGQWNYLNYNIDGIEIGAFSDHQLLLGGQIVKCKPGSNSYAAPLITASVANMYKRSYTVSYYKERLYSVSNEKFVTIFNRSTRLDWIQKATLLIISEEISSLVIEKNHDIDLELISISNLDMAVARLRSINTKSAVILYSEKPINSSLRNQITRLSYEKKLEIIYLDKLNYKLNDYWRINSKYWFPLTTKEVKKYSTASESNSPIICIECSDVLLLMELTDLLRHEFFLENYQVLLIANNPLLTIIDSFFIEFDMFITGLYTSYFSLLEDKFEHDVVFVAVDTSIRIKNCDLYILISNSYFEFKYELVSEFKRVEFTESDTSNIAKKIYHEIINIIS